ncbi:DUF3014 domain-containing protein [Rheinheimera pacifica]|nr:DUF3014 domain-containing protein [Rheinheimera pacifica]
MQRLIALHRQIATEVVMAEQKPNNNQQLYYAGIAAIVIVVLIALWLLLAKDDEQEPAINLLPPAITEPVTPQPETEPEQDTLEPDTTEPSPEQVTEPGVTEAVAEPEVALPVLDESDAEVKQRLLALNWRSGLAGLFVTEEMLRNFVVQTDNIAQGQLATGHRLLRPLEQKFALGEGDPMQLNESSFARYQPYIQLIESVPAEQMLALFNRYEPLLQQAYAELGYPDELFKHKLIAAIDVLLETPEVSYPLTLERPSVVYVFADPAIEQLPAPQKQMLRLGPDNQQRFKAVLQRYKQLLQ